MYTVRFPNDNTGYRITGVAFEGWVLARVGFTDKQAWINLTKAYLIEPDEVKL